MKIRFQVTFGFYLLSALGLLLVPIPWLAGALTAAIFHEGFHCLAVWLCGGQVLEISFAALGARIETTPLAPGKELFCALAGPLGSFSVLFLAACFPEAALCGLAQGAYNLLPVFPMDGGRALRCLLPGEACTAVEAVFLTLASGLCLMSGAKYAPLLLLFLWLPLIPRKTACKAPKFAVQYHYLCAARYIHDKFAAKDPPHGAEACPVHRRRIQ